MNMFAKTAADSVASYLAAVPADRKPIIDFLHAFIQKEAPGLEPHFAYNMLGYGSFKYYDKRAKQNKAWPVVALANQKNYVSLYVCAVDGDQYLPEKHQAQLGKVSVGRSCIRFKKIEDLNLETVSKILKEAKKSPGLVGDEKARTDQAAE